MVSLVEGLSGCNKRSENKNSVAGLVVGGGSKLDTERELIRRGSARRSAEREYNLNERELQTLATVTTEEGEN